MSRRTFLIGIASSLLVLGAVATIAGAAASSGPHLGIMRFSLVKQMRWELLNVGADGRDQAVIAGGDEEERPLPDLNEFAWSPDGSSLLFTGMTGNLEDETRRDLFLATADGESVSLVPGTEGAISPVIAPDGHTFAFERERRRGRPPGRGGDVPFYESASVWLGDLGAAAPRRITPWRHRLRQSPSSFSPDGRTLAVTRLVGERKPEAIGLKLDGRADSVLERNALQPVYSPDGSKLAFLRGEVERHGNTTARVTDLYVKSFGGGGTARLTKTSRALELSPSWDPSGQRLAWIEWNPFSSESAFFGLGDKLMQANADGSCRIKTLSDRRAAVLAVEWQPGPGREAGPIGC